MNTTAWRKLILMIVACSGLMTGLLAQETPAEFAKVTLLKGYQKRISGDTLGYYSFNPLARSSMLTRCTSGDMVIEWETQAIPADAKGDYAYFIWIGSYSTYTSSGVRNFDVAINGKPALRFQNLKEPAWKQSAKDGTELTFQLVHVDQALDAIRARFGGEAVSRGNVWHRRREAAAAPGGAQAAPRMTNSY